MHPEVVYDDTVIILSFEQDTMAEQKGRIAFILPCWICLEANCAAISLRF
jgi:hypothetical protein